MSIQDSLPERRNLTLISLAFIAYFYGGGHFTSNEVKLVIINASFSKPSVLILIAWSSLFWCLWRYWLVTKNQSYNGLKKDIEAVATNGFSYNYVAARVPYRFHKKAMRGNVLGYFWGGNIVFRNLMLSATIQHDTYFKRENHKNPTERDKALKQHLKENPLPDFIVKFDDFLGITYLVYVLLIACLIKPSFTSFIFPYLLCILAILGAVT